MHSPIGKLSFLILLLALGGCCNRNGYFDKGNIANEISAKSQCAAQKDAVVDLWKYQCRNPNLTNEEIWKHASPILIEYNEHYRIISPLSAKDRQEDCPSLMRDTGGMYDYGKLNLGKNVYEYCLQKHGLKYGQGKSISSTCPIGKPIGF